MWPGVDAQAASGVCGCGRVEAQPLGRGDDTARQTCTYHESVGGLQFLLAPFIAYVAIVLLVAAMEFQKLVVVVADGAGNRVVPAFFNGAAQVPAICFDQIGRASCRERVLQYG